MTDSAMTGHGCVADFTPRGGRGRAVLLWSVAALAVISAHAGAFALLAREQEPVADASAGAPAMMIDLAAMPTAVDTDATNVSDSLEDSRAGAVAETEPPDPEPQPVEPEPEPEPEPQSEPTPESLPEPTPVTEPMPDVTPPPPTETAEVALPTPVPPPTRPLERPDPPKEKAQTKQPVKPRREQPRSVAQQKAAAQVTQADRSVAQRTDVVDAAAPQVVASWKGRVAGRLQRFKRFPPGAESLRGLTLVTFTFDASGNVLSVAIARSSGYAVLDQATVEMVRRASPIPAPPAGVPLTLTVPMRYERG